MDNNRFKKFRAFYITTAINVGRLSYCERSQVGSIIVKDGAIISTGFNGTPHGFENKCEDSTNTTKDCVIHAEMNAILKVAKSSNNTEGSRMYVSLSPCAQCAKNIIQSGITHLFFFEEYRDTSSIDILIKAGIKVYTVDIDGEILKKWHKED